MKPPYHDLPISGRLTVNTGEVIEFRAKSSKLEDGVHILEEAWIRDGGDFVGPFSFHCYPRPQTKWQKLRSWIRKIHKRARRVIG